MKIESSNVGSVSKATTQGHSEASFEGSTAASSSQDTQEGTSAPMAANDSWNFVPLGLPQPTLLLVVDLFLLPKGPTRRDRQVTQQRCHPMVIKATIAGTQLFRQNIWLASARTTKANSPPPTITHPSAACPPVPHRVRMQPSVINHRTSDNGRPLLLHLQFHIKVLIRHHEKYTSRIP
jgi:hypothetical protein